MKIYILNSEWSDEFIDCTVMCFFSVCIHTRKVVEKVIRFSALRVVSDNKSDPIGNWYL